MDTLEHVDWFRNRLLLEGYAPLTAHNYARSLHLWLAWPNRIDDAQGFIDHEIARGMATPSVRHRWHGVLCFFRLGGMERLEMTEIPPVRLPKGMNRPTYGAITRREISTLEAALPVRGSSFLRQRVRTALYLYYTTGLRLGEGISIQWRDIDYEGGRILIRKQKNGKGEFRVSLLPVLEPELRSLEAFGYRPWVFSSREGDRPARAGVERALRRLIHKAAPGRCIHSLRHSFITHLIEEGVPLSVVQRLARHANITTTARYIHLTDALAEQELRRAHPWAKRES